MSTFRVVIQTRGALQRFVVCECGEALAMFGLQALDAHILEHLAARESEQ